MSVALWADTFEPSPKRSSFSVIIENDKWSDTDRHYTNGFQMAYFLAPGKEGSWVKRVADMAPFIDEKSDLRQGFFFGHEIYTPNDIQATQRLGDERPYAGWLYGGLSFSSNTLRHFDVWRVNLGVVGPSALGEEVQNNFHKLIGVDEALGWDNQLKNEFGYSLLYERGWRENIFGDGSKNSIGLDVIPHAGFSLGNVDQFINAGMTFRVGNDLNNDFGPPRIRPSLPGSEYFDAYSSLAWYVFAGGGIRYVDKNIFIDSHPNSHQYRIDKKPWVWDIQAGFVLSFKHFRFTYTYVYRSIEFNLQPEEDRFASFGFSYLF